MKWAAAGAGSGTVTSSGSPLNNEIAVFATAIDINSDSTFTWDGTTFTAFATTITASGLIVGNDDFLVVGHTGQLAVGGGTPGVQFVCTTTTDANRAVVLASVTDSAGAILSVSKTASGTL